MKARPPYQTNTPAAERGVDAHDWPPAALPAIPPPPEPCVGTRVVSLDRGGIGDVLCAITAAAGLPGRTLFKPPANRAEWAELLTDDLVYEWPLVLSDHDNAGKAVPRWEYWAARLGTTARLPDPKSLPAEAVEWAIPYAGRVVLAPFARAANRTWPLAHWIEVERLLAARGLRCLVLSAGGFEDVSGFAGDKLVDQRPARVGAVIAAAAAFAGCDSGMTHLAGYYRVPSVAVCSHVSDNRIFGLYPTVRELGGERFAGFLNVEPADVADAVLGQIRGAVGDFPADEFEGVLHERDRNRLYHWLTIYPALWRVVREINPSSIVEIGTRAGYSAWTMLRATPRPSVWGIDKDCDEHGGFAGAFAHAYKICDTPEINASRPPGGKRFMLQILDSHKLTDLPPCDLAFVDGDHTEEGALQDLELCHRSGVPTILFDDVTNLPECKRAADRFCAAHGLTPTYIPSRTGLYRIDLPPR